MIHITGQDFSYKLNQDFSLFFIVYEVVCVGLAYRNPETSPNGMPVQLNPPHDYLLQYGDQVLVLAEDDDTYEPGAPQSLTVPLMLSCSLALFRSIFATHSLFHSLHFTHSHALIL